MNPAFQRSLKVILSVVIVFLLMFLITPAATPGLPKKPTPIPRLPKKPTPTPHIPRKPTTTGAILRVPGHAFISWEPTKRNYATPDSHYFLETALVGFSSFGTAMETAQDEMRSNIASGAFKGRQAFAPRISDLRKQGGSPQPYR